MKKSVRNSKSNESLKTLNENKRLLSRSQPTITPSLHPWYYVKGRKDLTEKNISSRRERDDQKYRQSVSNNQYFTKRLAETKLFDNWKDNKSLVKHPKQSHSLKPPFDVMNDIKTDERLSFRSNKELEKKYLKSKEKLKQFLVKIKELNEKYNDLEKQQNILVFQLNQLMEMKTSLEEKKELFEFKNKRLICLRLSRDKLRTKVFEIMDQLKAYKTCVQNIQHLRDTKEVLTEEEMIELSEVMERGVKILDLYLQLNDNRNNEFQTLYDEEADNRWEAQEDDWNIEYEVWNQMIAKLIDSYKNVMKDKLSLLLAQMNTSLEEREQLIKELTVFTTRIKSEPKLSLLLTENIYDFMNEVMN